MQGKTHSVAITGRNWLVVRIGQLDVHERLVSRATPGSMALVQWYGARETSRGRRRSLRETSERSRTTARDVAMRNVVRCDYPKGLCNMVTSVHTTARMKSNGC